MTRTVIVSPEAAAEIDEIDNWWRANRDKAPDLFAHELERTFEMLATAPGIGRLQRRLARPDVRRVVLRKTKFHVYYQAEGSIVEVLVVWGGRRGTEPVLAGRP